MMTEHTTIRKNQNPPQFFPLADYPTWEEVEALKFRQEDAGLPGPSRFCHETEKRDYIQAIYAKEKRRPKKGEWYLSGAFILAYKAQNDLDTEFHIAKLVRVRRITITSIVATEGPDEIEEEAIK